MCGQKTLFVEMQEVKDGHVSFRDASKVQAKGEGKISFSQKVVKKDRLKMSIMCSN